MKRKLFSAILFGALLTASTSGLTSCKDYDDDISNLQSQIDKLATADQLSAEVSKLQTAIAAAQSAAESKAAAAETVAKEAKEAAQKANDAASAANNAAKAAQDAADKLKAEAATKADLQEAAKAAQDAVTAIQAEIAKAATKDEVTTAIETAKQDLLAKINANTAKLTELDGKLADLAARLDAIEAGEGQEGDLAAIQAEVEAIAEYLESLGISVSEMITAVHLYKLDGFNNDLQFWQVKEAVDRTFPFGDEVENVTNETVEFKKGTVRALEDSVLVRISPASAVLHAEDISLINTQGKEFDASLFESIDVKEFNREAPLTKAAGNNNTGLWVVKFKLNKDFDADKLDENAYYKKAQIRYALAVKNCDENLSEDRRVATEFDVTAAAPLAKHATTFTVQPATAEAATSVSDIHHRFTAYTNPLAGTFPASLKEDDWQWKENLNGDKDLEAGKANLTFDKKAEGDAQNAKKETPRQEKSVLAVSEGEKIAIKFDEPVKAFYVTVDWKRAGESGKSEINAWNTYSYTNVGKVDDTGKVIEAAPIQYGNEGFISVDELKQYASLGDVIGFRVWAINLDGSMVDPDGTAFYVGIGQNADINVKEVAGSALVTTKTPNATQNVVMIDVSDAFGIDFDDATFSQETYNMDGDVANEKVNGYKPTVTSSLFAASTGKDIKIKAYKADGKTAATVAQDVKKLSVQIANPQYLVDGKTYTIKATLTGTVGATTATVRYVNIKVTKEMPTTIPAELTVERSDLQDEEQLVIPTAWTVGNVTAGGYDAKYQWQTTGSYANLKNLKPTYSTTVGCEWQLTGASAQKSGEINLNNAYYLPNRLAGNQLDYQKELSFEIAGARIARPTETDNNGNILGAQTYVHRAPASVTPGGYKADSIAGQFVNGNSYGVTAKYTYKEISHSFRKATPSANAKTWNDVSVSGAAPATAEDVTLSQSVDPIKLMSWSTQATDYVTYKWGMVCTQSGSGTPGTNTYVADKFELANKVAFGGGTLSLGDVQAYYGKKTANVAGWMVNNDYGTASLYNLLDSQYLKLVSAKLLYGGAASPIFSVDVTGSTVTFTPLSATTTAHEETLVIEVIDCFSQHSVIELPVSVGVTGNQAAQSITHTDGIVVDTTGKLKRQ